MMSMSGVGRFVKDPELKAVGDTHVCEFSLAVNEFRKTNQENVAHFFDFVIWDKAAEVITKYCHKGDMIEIIATPRQDKWKDAEDRGRSRVVFRVDRFNLMPRSLSAKTAPEITDVDADVEVGEPVGEPSPF